jgi:hypothetical protein
LVVRQRAGASVAFDFHAGFVHPDDLCRRLSFADRDDESGEHYFIMDRSEESPDEAVPDMENVYIERDDQAWGGYGGIERVILARDSLALYLGERMAKQMGGHDSVRVSFEVSDAIFRDLRNVLCLIMRGYESKLAVAA